MPKVDPERWVYEEWLALTLFTPEQPATREDLLRARGLYAKTYAGGEWTVRVSSASMVTIATMHLELKLGELQTAEQTLRSLFEHPDYPQEDEVVRHHAEFWMAAFEIWRGDLEGGIRRMRGLYGIKPRTFAFHGVRASLCLVLDQPLPIPDPIPSALVAFTLDFLGMHQGMQKAVAAWDGSRVGLVGLLRDSHGRKPKPPSAPPKAV